jgi:lysophospholipase L1-like esterase
MKILDKLFLILILLASFSNAFSQEKVLKWWNPKQSDVGIIDGQAWAKKDIKLYNRLPNKAKYIVREGVWNLSENSAGLCIRFRSNSDLIQVRYKVRGGKAMSHMPATGVSGVDMYAKDSNGAWSWCGAKYSFGDTIKYDYSNLKEEQYHKDGREYRLYLPLYNTVENLEIGIPEEKSLEVLPLRQEKPLVVYGTSITQGACASRPGMAWTSILGRAMDRPLINLGFSGNGRFEEPLIDLMIEIEAKMYILDCLPNMTPGSGFTPEDTYSRIINSVKQLRLKRPNTPILLVEHSGYSDGELNKERFAIYSELNKAMKRAFEDLLSADVKDLFLLTKKEINLDLNSYVDGTHPSDLGMMQYAKAYEKITRRILKEPSGTISTTIPGTQLRELNNYDWEARHQKILALNKQSSPEICVLGNSIVNFWAGQPEAPITRGQKSWDKLFASSLVRNMGFGWDRIENLLWRVNHDELDGFDAKQIILMIGTNNLAKNNDSEILTGIDTLIGAIKMRQPNSKIIMFGILPRRNQEERITFLNKQIAQVASSHFVSYGNIGNVFLNKNGKINENLFTDGLHPNQSGYSILAKKMKVVLKNERG